MASSLSFFTRSIERWPDQGVTMPRSALEGQRCCQTHKIKPIVLHEKPGCKNTS